MSTKIADHPQRKEVEGIIIDCKFQGLGSTKIQQAIRSKIGVDVSRPTIDSHYKEHMNGDVLTRNIEEQNKLILMSGGEGGGIVPPVVDMERIEQIRDHYKSGTNSTAKLKEIREYIIVLIDSNFKAFIGGKERFKPEYAKYLKDLDIILKAK